MGRVIDKLFDHFDASIGRKTLSDRPIWELNETIIE